MRRISSAVISLAALATLACTSGSTTSPQNPATITYAPSLGVNLSTMTQTSDGLYYKDLVTGTGATAAANMTVTVDYTGWLNDGTQFGTSIGGSPLKFVLGTGAVIAGWDEGLVGMQVGGTRLLVVPSYLAYGQSRVGIIPPGSVLVFNVTLLNAQ